MSCQYHKGPKYILRKELLNIHTTLFRISEVGNGDGVGMEGNEI